MTSIFLKSWLWPYLDFLLQLMNNGSKHKSVAFIFLLATKPKTSREQFDMAKCSISCWRRIAFHRLLLACQREALSFHRPHTDGRVFLNTGVMASHRACKAYGRGRWWLISGICSNSDSWRPTSPPLIRGACSVMDITQPLSEGEGPLKGNEPRVPWDPHLRPNFFPPAGRNCYHFRRGQRINMPCRKTTALPCIRCALIPSQDTNRSTQLHNRLKQSKRTCRISWVTGFFEKENLERHASEFKKPDWLLDCAIAVDPALCNVFHGETRWPKAGR